MVPLQYHLIPRTKGFTVSLPYLKENCPNIYDINLAVTDDEVVSSILSLSVTNVTFISLTSTGKGNVTKSPERTGSYRTYVRPAL